MTGTVSPQEDPQSGAEMFDAEAYVKRILKLVLGTIGALIAFCVLGSIVTGRERAEQDEAAQRKAESDRREHEKLVAQLGTLDATAAPKQVAGLCVEILKVGAAPAAHVRRCGDALLVQGQSQLAANHPTEAVPLLEAAAKMSSKPDDSKAALATAKDRAEAARLLAAAQAKLSMAKTAETFDAKSAALKEAKANAEDALTKYPESSDAKTLRKTIVGQIAALNDRAKKAASEQGDRELVGIAFEMAAAKAGLDVRVSVTGTRLVISSDMCHSDEFARRFETTVDGTAIAELRKAKFSAIECYDPVARGSRRWNL